MTDFIKAKVGFALALLGVLFAIHPIILDIGNTGFVLFGVLLEVRIFYYIVSIVLGLAVYTYAIEFIRSKPVTVAHHVGNIIYAVALLIPAFYVLLWMTSLVARLAVIVSKSPFTGMIASTVLSAISGLVSGLFWNLFRRKLNAKDKEARVTQLSTEESSHIQRASELLKAGHYDLSALESFRAVEATLGRALIGEEISVAHGSFLALLNAAIKANIVSTDIGGVVNEIRLLRNQALHGAEPVTKTSAQHALEQAERILATVGRRAEIQADEEDTAGESQKVWRRRT